MDNFKEVVMDAVNRYDEEILQDIDRLNALLMDLAPSCDRERKLLIMCLREGVLEKLQRAKRNSMPELAVGRCVRQLVTDIWITEAAAGFVIEVLAAVIGIDYTYSVSRSEMLERDLAGNGGHCQGSSVLYKDVRGLHGGQIELEKVLRKVEIIGYKALSSNRDISTINIPPNVEKIMSNAFLNCSNLESIKFGSGILALSSNAFSGCRKLKEIDCENTRYLCKNGLLIDRKERETIKAENRTEISILEIPKGICRITSRSFEGSPVRELIISETVEEIEKNAFDGMTQIEKYEVSQRNKRFCSVSGVLHDRKCQVLMKYPVARNGGSYIVEDGVKIIGEKAFSGVQNLRAITFASGTECIESAAFEFCDSVESFILPYGISVIGERAFQFCCRLRSVMLSGKIKEIGDCAFYECSSLESMSIPASVNRIGNYAFWGCGNLHSVIIQNEVSQIGYGAFDGCGNIQVKIKSNDYVERYCKAHRIPYILI